MQRALVIAVVILELASSATIAAEDKPPEELYSPDQRYSVRILHSALPGADPHEAFFTIVLRSGDHYIAKYPTIGYLIDAFWSPDGQYVAVDNWRANSGDYLWVFRLTDGRAIRMPVDVVPGRVEDAYERYARDLVGRVNARFPDLTYSEFNKLFTFAKGWTPAGELQMKTNFGFRNLSGEIAILLQTYRVAGDQLILVHEMVDKAPWRPKA